MKEFIVHKLTQVSKGVSSQREREFYESWKPQKNRKEWSMVRGMYAEVGMEG